METTYDYFDKLVDALKTADSLNDNLDGERLLETSIYEECFEAQWLSSRYPDTSSLVDKHLAKDSSQVQLLDIAVLLQSLLKKSIHKVAILRGLEEEMHGSLHSYSLRNNYRTCANLMKVMEQYFFAWSRQGLLHYEEPVRPFNTRTGTVEMEYVENKSSWPAQTMRHINEALDDLETDIRSGKKKVNDKTKVAVLVRGNQKAAEIAALCRKNGKTVVLNSDRPFFLSRAVRDFYALISSYIFAERPIYTYNYLMTPYAAYEGTVSVSEMERIKMNGAELTEYLSGFLSQTKWHEYQRKFRLKPVVAVIKDIVENSNVIENFIAMDKVKLYGNEWSEAKKNRQALIDAKLYQKNLDKLLEMIQQRMDGEFATLYDLYIYLTLMIATNRDEMEPDVEMTDDYTSVYIMTVHKSKGLEYDTVILPAMGHSLVPRERTSILLGKEKAAWAYEPEKSSQMKSRWYEELQKEAVRRGVEEETRMLYVAMTYPEIHLMS